VELLLIKMTTFGSEPITKVFLNMMEKTYRVLIIHYLRIKKSTLFTPIKQKIFGSPSIIMAYGSMMDKNSLRYSSPSGLIIARLRKTEKAASG
jgi:hypothetical protein